MTIIRLDGGWDCETVRANAGDGATDTVLVSLVCRRRFELAPVDFCARYLLHVDAAPGPLTIILRGEVVAHNVAAGALVDVTDFVSLDDNLLELRVDSDAMLREGRFGGVWLQAVPCEE